MTKLHKRELQHILDAGAGFQPAHAFIAGGAVTSAFSNAKIADVDYYFKSQEAFEEAILDAYDDGLWAHSVTDRCVTFVDKAGAIVQLMNFAFFATADAVFDLFDFTCCMGAYDIDAKEFVFHPLFLKHVAQRHLSFHNGTRYPFASLLRVGKYQERGYKIGKNDLIRIALRCHQEKLESWEDLASAIGGQYGEKVKIEGADKPFSITAALDVVQSTAFLVPAEPQSLPGDGEELIRFINEGLKVDKNMSWWDFRYKHEPLSKNGSGSLHTFW